MSDKPTPATETISGPILVIDVGGTHVKVQSESNLGPDGKSTMEALKIVSGPKMTAQMMVDAVRQTVTWPYTAVAMGYPGPVLHGRPVNEPANLGSGWVGFDFAKAFAAAPGDKISSVKSIPVKIINDAALQALGSYQGGRMLFLGLGTGLGSTMIVDGILEPMELAHLPYKKHKTYEDYVGLRGMERLGKKKWRKEVDDVVARLSTALEPDYVVLGGGNSKYLKDLPDGVRLGSNDNAFLGGVRLWRGLGELTATPIGSQADRKNAG